MISHLLGHSYAALAFIVLTAEAAQPVTRAACGVGAVYFLTMALVLAIRYWTPLRTWARERSDNDKH
jgi:hypothetical protein